MYRPMGISTARRVATNLYARARCSGGRSKNIEICIRLSTEGTPFTAFHNAELISVSCHSWLSPMAEIGNKWLLYQRWYIFFELHGWQGSRYSSYLHAEKFILRQLKPWLPVYQYSSIAQEFVNLLTLYNYLYGQILSYYRQYPLLGCL